MIRITLLVCILISIVACNNSSNQNGHVLDSKKRANSASNVLRFSDTLFVKSKCAIIFSPDSLRLRKEISTTGEDDFQVAYDDYVYYISESSSFLRKKGIRVDTTSKGWISFQLRNGTSRLVKIDTLEGLFGIIVFDGISEPRNIDIVDAEKEYDLYFLKKEVTRDSTAH